LALLACFNSGGLQKQDGSWRGKSGDKPINGNTVASLSREGLLAVTKDKKSGSARLTERGEWFAKTLLSSTGKTIE
jgi:hypothetical protein